MKKGYLNKSELAKLAKMHAEIDAMASEIPRAGLTSAEETTLEILTETRNRLGELLRWQAPQTIAAK